MAWMRAAISPHCARAAAGPLRMRASRRIFRGIVSPSTRSITKPAAQVVGILEQDPDRGNGDSGRGRGLEQEVFGGAVGFAAVFARVAAQHEAAGAPAASTRSKDHVSRDAPPESRRNPTTEPAPHVGAIARASASGSGGPATSGDATDSPTHPPPNWRDRGIKYMPQSRRFADFRDDGGAMSDDDPKALLDEARDRARRRVQELAAVVHGIIESAQDANLDDEHDPEGSTIGFERAQAAALLDQARDQLAELDAARERLASGTYGICEGCGRPIAPARLEAQPATRVCIECAAATDRGPARRR